MRAEDKEKEKIKRIWKDKNQYKTNNRLFKTKLIKINQLIWSQLNKSLFKTRHNKKVHVNSSGSLKRNSKMSFMIFNKINCILYLQ